MSERVGGCEAFAAGPAVVAVVIPALVFPAVLMEAGASGEPARELVVEPFGEVWNFGMPSLSLMRLRVPSDISPPEPARPSLSLPEPAV